MRIYKKLEWNVILILKIISNEYISVVCIRLSLLNNSKDKEE